MTKIEGMQILRVSKSGPASFELFASEELATDAYAATQAMPAAGATDPGNTPVPNVAEASDAARSDEITQPMAAYRGASA